jgi:hypothetical protein
MVPIRTRPTEFFVDIEPARPDSIPESLYFAATRVVWLWNECCGYVEHGSRAPERFLDELNWAQQVLNAVAPGTALHSEYILARGVKTKHLKYPSGSGERIVHSAFLFISGAMSLRLKAGSAAFDKCRMEIPDPTWLIDELENERLAMLERIRTGRVSTLPPRDESSRLIFAQLPEGASTEATEPPAFPVVHTFSEWQHLLRWSTTTWGRRRRDHADCFTDVPGENSCSIREPELTLWLASAENKKRSPFEKT